MGVVDQGCDGGDIALRGGDPQRGAPTLVRCLGVGTGPEKQMHTRASISRSRLLRGPNAVKRGPAPVVAAETGIGACCQGRGHGHGSDNVNVNVNANNGSSCSEAAARLLRSGSLS